MSPAPDQPQTAAAEAAASAPALSDLFNLYIPVFAIAFIVTVCVTPVMRRLAISQGIIDRPSETRKMHRVPIAYLGGLAVFIGVFAAILYSYVGVALPRPFYDVHQSVHELRAVPMSIVLGMGLITLIGLIDDVAGLDPRLKVAGQLLAAAALALNDVGVKVAQGFMGPVGALFGKPDLTWVFDLPVSIPILAPTSTIELDLIYWTGTAIIAVFVLGACNASNLIDGLDGLLSGVTAIAVAAILFVSLELAIADDGPLDAARIVLSLAVLGACLGFLPHNFNPATIFLGDCGSLLLGYLTIVLVLSLGDTGKTHLVVAGLIIYAVPIIDTVLAIVRRKLAGKSMSEADDQHLHHMLKRALGVKGAVITLYAAGALFGTLGAILTEGRVRLVVIAAVVIAGFIGVTAVKIARRAAIEAEVHRFYPTQPARKQQAPIAPAAPRPAEETEPAPTP